MALNNDFHPRDEVAVVLSTHKGSYAVVLGIGLPFGFRKHISARLLSEKLELRRLAQRRNAQVTSFLQVPCIGEHESSDRRSEQEYRLNDVVTACWVEEAGTVRR